MLKSWQDSHCSYDAAYSDGMNAGRGSQNADASPYGQCMPETRDAAMRGYREGYAAAATAQAAANAAAQQQWLAANCNYDAAFIQGTNAYQSGVPLDVTPYGQCAEPMREQALRGYRIGYERAQREAPPSPPPSSSPSPLPMTTIVNQPAGKCLDASPRPDGATLQLWQCSGRDSQGFALRPLGDGRVNIIHVASGRCVDAGGSRGPGDPGVRLWRCNGAPSQSFSRVDLGYGSSRLVNAASNACVDVQSHSFELGALIMQAPCDNSDSQRWGLPQLAATTTPSPAHEVEAGPIFNQPDAEAKCPQTCRPPEHWNGQWRTTVPGRMSVCSCAQ
jgi:hypothetical protein